jgi:uroporphyrinogen decarboxylase
MNKRDFVLSLLDQNAKLPYIPAAFFLHFDPEFHHGLPAINKHLEYFYYTGMDFVKVQYEHRYPLIPEIKKPGDWVKMPRYGKDFFEQPVKVVEGLVKAAGKEALVIVTLYSPFMCAGHATGNDLRDQHMQDNPQAVKAGMEAVTDSVLTFIQECIRVGVDGFYASTQGNESHRFSDPAVFQECIKPYDLAVMDEINHSCKFNILHICDYHDSYKDLRPFLEYPGHIVNCNLHLDGGEVSAVQVSELFGRPFMGGLDRKGVLATGTPEQIKEEVNAILQSAPERFLLAADCTVPSSTDWKNLRTAIKIAHQYTR